MRLSAMGAQKTRDESKKLNMYSKQWLPGDVLRVYYPLFWEDGVPQIAVGAVWGFDVGDIQALGLKTAFIPATNEFDENKQPIGVPDITYQFSHIAPLFVHAMKARDEAEVVNKPWPTEAGRKDALKAVEHKYDTKNNMKAIKPIIGKVKYYISTEVISIKLLNDTPVMDTLTITSAPLSGQNIQRLYTIMNDPKYKPAEGAKFLEVEWRYPIDPDKGTSAKKAAPAGVTHEYTIENTSPDAYKQIEGMFSMVATEAETITRRATRTVNPEKVRQALTQYCIMNSQFIDSIIEDDEEVLIKNVGVVKELDIIPSLTNTELVEKIQEALREAAALDIPKMGNVVPQPDTSTASTSMPTDAAQEVSNITDNLPDLNSGVTSSLPDMNTGAGQSPVTIQDLLNNPDRIDDDAVDGADFTNLV